MDKFKDFDYSLIDEIGINAFNRIISKLGETNYLIKAIYLNHYQDMEAYSIFKDQVAGRHHLSLDLYSRCLPYINIEIRNKRINEILDN